MHIEPVPPASIDWLRDSVSDAHDRTLSLLADLDDTHLLGPKQRVLTPPLWIIGHIAWFYGQYFLDPLEANGPDFPGAGALFDSDAVPHPTIWDLDLPSLGKLIEYKIRVRDAVMAALGEDKMATPEQTALCRLCLHREDALGEQMLANRQHLGLPAPDFVIGADFVDSALAAPGDVPIPGGVHSLGSIPEDVFFMDNEQWGHGYEAKPFTIAPLAVTNDQYRTFVADGGYQNEALWSPAGWGWRKYAEADHPVYWRKDSDGWSQRIFDQWAPLLADAPVIHVNWFEADAWCRWADRRLPWEAEWEIAASLVPQSADQIRGPKRYYPWGEEYPDASRANLNGYAGQAAPVAALAAGDSGYGCRQMLGNIWEWTQSSLSDFPGFVPGPWETSSKPFMDGNHAVLRGGSWATRSRAVWNNFRGFSPLDRRDLFAGFRSCAL